MKFGGSGLLARREKSWYLVRNDGKEAIKLFFPSHLLASDFFYKYMLCGALELQQKVYVYGEVEWPKGLLSPQKINIERIKIALAKGDVFV